MDLRMRRRLKTATYGLKILGLKNHPLREMVMSPNSPEFYTRSQRRTPPFSVRANNVLTELDLISKPCLTIDFDGLDPWMSK